MKQLNTYIQEGLFKNVGIGSSVIKQETVNWINERFHIQIFVKGFAETYLMQERNLVEDSKYGFITNFDQEGDGDLVRITAKYEGKQNLTSLTNGEFQWGEVKGFNCECCEKLKSLDGAPIKCDIFNCQNCNSLNSLKGLGECHMLFAGGGLKGGIKDFTGVPKNLKELRVRECDSLISLKGLPRKMDLIRLEWCPKLKDFTGAPIEITDQFFCRHCYSLESTKGCPQKVKGLIINQCSKLKDLSGLPKTCNLLDLYAIGIRRKAVKKAEVDKYCKPKQYFE